MYAKCSRCQSVAHVCNCSGSTDEIATLRSRVSELEAALEKIRDHEHCNETLTCIVTDVKYTTGHASGHRCCSAIATEALRGKK